MISDFLVLLLFINLAFWLVLSQALPLKVSFFAFGDNFNI